MTKLNLSHGYGLFSGGVIAVVLFVEAIAGLLRDSAWSLPDFVTAALFAMGLGGLCGAMHWNRHRTSNASRRATYLRCAAAVVLVVVLGTAAQVLHFRMFGANWIAEPFVASLTAVALLVVADQPSPGSAGSRPDE